MIDRLEIAQQQQHLDIAAGTGEPGLSVATCAPKGHVVLTDLSVEMLDIAARRAIAQGILNFETRVCSADNLPFDDATFDSVSVRFGYMFFPAVAAATAEFVRVLKPGGRVCASVWVKPESNPWTTIAMDAIATEPAADPTKSFMTTTWAVDADVVADHLASRPMRARSSSRSKDSAAPCAVF